jgi:hypothetical protein
VRPGPFLMVRPLPHRPFIAITLLVAGAVAGTAGTTRANDRTGLNAISAVGRASPIASSDKRFTFQSSSRTMCVRDSLPMRRFQ